MTAIQTYFGLTLYNIVIEEHEKELVVPLIVNIS